MARRVRLLLGGRHQCGSGAFVVPGGLSLSQRKTHSGQQRAILPRFYSSAWPAAFVDAQNGLFFTIAEISLLDLAARCTPVGAEGLGYGLILSFRNLAVYGADFLGSRLHKLYPHTFTFSTMVWL